jgi:hypothetical protein
LVGRLEPRHHQDPNDENDEDDENERQDESAIVREPDE